MITINFKYKGNTITGQIPTAWEELKVRHYIALEGTKDPLKLLSLLTDIDLSFILNTSTDLTPAINHVIKLVNSELPELERKPTRDIFLRGAYHKIPKDLNKVTYGQSLLIEQELNKHEDNEVLALAAVMAIVMQPVIDKGDFDLDRAQELETEIKELPISKVFGNVFFFWTVLKSYITFGAPNLARFLR